jgi:hypothetical protein
MKNVDMETKIIEIDSNISFTEIHKIIKMISKIIKLSIINNIM